MTWIKRVLLLKNRRRRHWHKLDVIHGVLRGRVVVADDRSGVWVGTNGQGAIVLCAALELYCQCKLKGGNEGRM